MSITKDQVKKFIENNPGCKLRNIMESLKINQEKGEDFYQWYQRSYRALDSILQELKILNCIEYRKGKGGGWYAKS